jgi:hypothetical protein
MSKNLNGQNSGWGMPSYENNTLECKKLKTGGIPLYIFLTEREKDPQFSYKSTYVCIYYMLHGL